MELEKAEGREEEGHTPSFLASPNGSLEPHHWHSDWPSSRGDGAALRVFLAIKRASYVPAHTAGRVRGTE